jgi:prolyl-tRNA editing enzyme YbaK/EbsC (Cys-tRNA(Pro) deacylase)
VQIANEVTVLSKSKINMRMVSEQVAQEMTGFGRNAVTPVGSATRIPIIMSHKITELSGLFFLGAGEVDLKVGMPAADFIRGFADAPVYVVDCTKE